MADSASPPVRPCPFCGWPATAMMDNGTKVWRVYCNDDGTCGDEAPGCCAEGPEAMTEAEAIAAWNTRTAITSHPLAEVTEAMMQKARKALSPRSNQALDDIDLRNIYTAMRSAATPAFATDDEDAECPACKSPIKIIANGRPDDLVRCKCTVVSLEWLRIASRLNGDGLRHILFDLAIAAGKLVVATDGQEPIREQRQKVLDFVAIAQTALSAESE